MRVFLLTSKINLETSGGAVIDLHLKARFLSEKGHDVTVVTMLSEKNRLPPDLPYAVAEEHLRSWRFFDVNPLVLSVLRKYESKADVFYVDGHLFAYGAGAYRLLGGTVPVVAFFNVKLPAWPPWPNDYGLLQRAKHHLRFLIERTLGVFLANRLDELIFTTPNVRMLYQKHGLDVRKAHILPDFAESGLSENAGFLRSGDEGPVRFFASGRMIKEKGFDILIKAFLQLRDTDATLTISGDGPEAAYLKSLAHEAGVTDRITFPGWVSRPNLYQLMDRSHVFILPHWIMEYSSVLLAESMMRGLPPIIPAGGGLEWIAADAGTTFAERDAESLASAMQQFVDYPERIEHYSQKALKRSKDFYYSRLGTDLEKIICDAATSN